MYKKNLTTYSLKNVSKKLNSINVDINSQYEKPFPNLKEQLLSYYTYKNRWITVFNNVYFNRARLVTSLIDFSFIRSSLAMSIRKKAVAALTLLAYSSVICLNSNEYVYRETIS